MRCANSQCGITARDLFEGTLWLVERHDAPLSRLRGDESGFPVCAVPSRYFWLCPECSTSMKIRGWTSAGILLAPHVYARKPATSEKPVGNPLQAVGLL
jgi:hypothetical protein